MDSTDSILCWREADNGTHTLIYYNITNDDWNCAEHYGRCDSCPKPQGDPDIAGLGVIIAFMISVISTAFLSVTFSILATVQPRKFTVRTNSRTTIAYDWVGKNVEKIIGRKHAVRCAKICYDMAICLGDQQLVGSIALLLATTKKLTVDKTLSVYHFELVLGMVYLSSTAFTFAMISYRLRHQWKDDDTQHLRHQQDGHQQWGRRLREGLPRAVRMFLKLTLTVFLVYNTSVVVRMYDLPWDCPAICFKNSRGYDWKSAILPPLIGLPIAIQLGITDFIQLALAHNWWDPEAYVALVSAKKQSLSAWYRHQCLPTARGETWRRISPPNLSLSRVCSYVCSYILRDLFVVFWLSITYYFGSLPMVTGLFVSLCKVTLFAWRRTHIQVPEYLHRLEAETEEEMQMGIGQIIAIFLMLLPVLQLVDSISVHYRETGHTAENIVSSNATTNSNLVVEISDVAEETSNQPTGTLSAGHYPWGPF